MQDGTGCNSPIQLATRPSLAKRCFRGNAARPSASAPPRPHTILLHTMHSAEAVNEIGACFCFLSRSCFFLMMLVCRPLPVSSHCCGTFAISPGIPLCFLNVEIVAREMCTGATFLAESGQPRGRQSWCRNTASLSAMLCGVHLAMCDMLRFFFSSVLTCETVTSSFVFFLIQP